MHFRFPSIILVSTVFVANLCGCSNTNEKLRHGSLRKVAVNQSVEMGGPASGQNAAGTAIIASAGASGGAIGAGLAALAVGAANSGSGPQVAENLREFDYDLRESVRQEFARMLNARRFFAERVHVVPDESSLPGEEILQRQHVAVFHLKVDNYGFDKAAFSSTLKPFVVVRAELRRGNETLWEGEAEANEDDQLPTGTAKEFAQQPQRVRDAWAAAARVVSSRLADEFAKSYR